MPHYSLGFDCYMQDAAAVLLRDGVLHRGVEEERLTRAKHTGAFPERAIRWCLSDAGITVADLDAVAFNMRPWEGVAARISQIARGLPRTLQFGQTRGSNWARMMTVKRRFQRTIGAGRYRFDWVRHHDTHALSALCPSPFEEAAVLIVDGSGELASTTAYAGSGTTVRPVWSIPFPHSLGYFYSALTEWLGFQPAVAEGKVMGLSSYGQPDARLMTYFRQMIGDDGRIDPAWFSFQDGGDHYFSERWIGAFGEPRVPESELLDAHHAMAATGQARLEEVLFALCRRLHADTGSDALCLAGGVALNCVANGKILEETPFSDLWVQPIAHDAGTAFGAALSAWGKPTPEQRSVALGPQYDDEAIARAIYAAGLDPTTTDNAPRTAAELLALGKVVGWFQGRCEMGPRALGHRSILADPRDPTMPDRVNERVKRREPFRPFAPAVLSEKASGWFDGTPTPFMTTVHRVIADGVPGITHVDGTARVQAVHAADSPDFHALISEFETLTGVPMVLNTSFNLRGEPIVCTPAEAVADYLKTEMDALVVGGQLLQKGPPG